MSEEGNLPAVKPDHPRPYLERPVAVVTLIGGVIGICTFVLSVSGFSPNRKNAQERIEVCKGAHGLSSSITRVETNPGQVLFSGCVWPPPFGADSDGFTEITVASRNGPGQSEAEGLTVADVFTTSCKAIEANYRFSSQGSFVADEPIRLATGEIRRVEGGPIWMPRNAQEAASFSPRRDESVILSNTRYELATVRCID